MPTIQVRPIVQGYAFTHRLKVTSDDLAPFTGARIVGQIRTSPSARTILATLDTDAGTLVIVAGDTLELRLSKAQTALLPIGTVTLDFVRFDGPDGEPLPFRIEWPVRQPVTRLP